MSAAWNNLLDDALHLGDVTGAGIFGGQREPIGRAAGTGLPAVDLAQLWRHLGDTMEVSTHHRLPAVQMRWIFERVLVYCVRRNDGLQLALVVKRASPGSFDATAAERLFEEFRSLKDT